MPTMTQGNEDFGPNPGILCEDLGGEKGCLNTHTAGNSEDRTKGIVDDT